MDEQLFGARRAGVDASVRTAEPDDPDARFRALVQSPLRAGILRFLHGRRNESFDVDALMQAFGRLRLDVENCVRELVDFGLAGEMRPPGLPVQFTATRPAGEALSALFDGFLERR